MEFEEKPGNKQQQQDGGLATNKRSAANFLNTLSLCESDIFVGRERWKVTGRDY